MRFRNCTFTLWCRPPLRGLCVSTGARKSPGIILVPERRKILMQFTVQVQFAERAQKSRAEPSRAEQSRAEQSRAEPSRAEQSRAEQSRAEPTEQSRAENKAEQSRAEYRTEQSRAEQRTKQSRV